MFPVSFDLAFLTFLFLCFLLVFKLRSLELLFFTPFLLMLLTYTLGTLSLSCCLRL